jgi:murein L,D-transpeptidase YcbB/YkuD
VLSDGPPEEYYDSSLADAVAAFQESSGLPGKGVVNAATRAALNKSVSTAGPAQILINMERWRWEPRELGTRHIYVNIPEFLLRLMDGGRLVHEERIVVGTPKNRTPAFSDEMEYVVFNPYWNVPESILLKEMLPVARRNPEFFARNQLEVVWQGRRVVDPYMVDWEEVNPQKVLVRQVPGPSNALGVVKFLFPNKHSVYMHDTPSKNLFNQSVRAYSHGCMRVRNPVKFAEVLLGDQGWSPAKVRSAIETTEDYQVTLDRKLPVHIMYFTLWADRSGRLQEFGDVYDYDDRLKVAMKLEAAPKPRRKQQEFEPRENGLGN